MRSDSPDSAQQVLKALKSQADSEKAKFYPRFFKTGSGEYGEGDSFLGVTVPDQRVISKQFRNLPMDQVKELLQSKWHECRLTALFILVLKFDRAKEPIRRELVEFYLVNLDRVNNWDFSNHKRLKMLVVIGLTIVAGILGGIGNWFMGTTPAAQSPLEREIPSVPLWWQLLSCITLGVIAASLIPLFLSMAKSDLLASATGQGVGSSKAAIDCFVYFGFCLVAAVTSRNFIDTVASRALRLAGDNEQKVAQISRNMEEITAAQEEPEPSAFARDLTDPALTAPTEPKILVLNAVALHPRFTRRNVSSISQDTGLPLDEVNALLQQMSLEGLVENKTSTDGRILWMATKRGRASLN